MCASRTSGKKREKEKRDRERKKCRRKKVNMYSGADVEITAEAARGRRLRRTNVFYIVIICTRELSSSRIFVTNEISAVSSYICT